MEIMPNCEKNKIQSKTEFKKILQKQEAPRSRPKKYSPEYKKGKTKGHKNGLSKKRNKLEKISKSIQGICILEDSYGKFIANCTYEGHLGAIGEYRFFEKNCAECPHVEIYRLSKKRYFSKK